VTLTGIVFSLVSRL